MFGDIALGAQRQIAEFFASDGKFVDPLADITTTAPDGTVVPLFEVPIKVGRCRRASTTQNSASAAAPTQVSGSLASDTIPTAAASNQPKGKLLDSTLTAAYMPASMRLNPGADSALIDQAIEGVATLGWFGSDLNLDDLAAGLLHPTRRRR